MSSETAQDITCTNEGDTYITTVTGQIKRWSCANSIDSVATDSLALEQASSLLASLVEGAQIRAFPNPFNDGFSVEWPSLMEGEVQLTLFGPGGQIKYSYVGKSNAQQILAGRDWPAGIYWMTIQYDGERETIRLLKI